MNSNQHDYHAYLLRLWREGTQQPWRATLVSPHTGAKQHFASQGELLTFLTVLTGEDESGGETGKKDTIFNDDGDVPDGGQAHKLHLPVVFR